MQSNFRDEIRSLRKARGLSQRRVAELLGVTTVTVWNWEAGRVAPWEKHRAAILHKLGEAGSDGFTPHPKGTKFVHGTLLTKAEHDALTAKFVARFKRRRLIDNVGSDQ